MIVLSSISCVISEEEEKAEIVTVLFAEELLASKMVKGKIVRKWSIGISSHEDKK